MKGLSRTIIGLTCATLLALWYIGYIGGTCFGLVPATAAARPPHQRVVALYLSGDMGFHAGLGPDIAQRLAGQGISIVTENSLHFFRTRRTPEQSGAMIAQGLRRALAIDPGARLVLLGQSFGADVIAPSLPYVPTRLRRRIAFVGLIVPGATRQWRASPSEIFSFNEPEENAVTAAQGLSWVPLLCIHGEQEKASLCPFLRQPNATVVQLSGGHELNHDADRAGTIVLRALDRALAGAGQGR